MELCLVPMKQITADFLHVKQCETILRCMGVMITLQLQIRRRKSFFVWYFLQSNSQVLFDVVDDAQTDGLNEPILLLLLTGICKHKQLLSLRG